MPFTVAVVGRPNVGKSTLFNRLVGKRLAIVDDTPGVTRDRREGEGRLGGLTFTVVDTAGFEDAGGDSLEARMREQTERAVDEADLALFLIDARAGVTPLDRHFAQWLRKRRTPVVLLANKCEGRAGQPGLHEAYGLGLGEPVPLSAEHGEGLGELYDILVAHMPETVDAEREEAPEEDDGETGGPLQLAVVGRPNVGKSTLVNALLGDERMLTGPEAGITRDAIATTWSFKGRPIRLIDTAGMRKKAKVEEKLETLSVGDTLRAIRYAQVVVLVIDALSALEKQDLQIARLVVEEGRALVVAVNKWDLVADPATVLADLNERLEITLPRAKGLPVVTLSAKTGKGVNRLLPKVLEIEGIWRRRIATARLNRWLEGVLEHHPPPLVKGRRVKIRYMTQVKSRPPTFMLSVSQDDGLPEAYLRYLENGIRETFGMPGVPLRLLARKGGNPFAGKS
jgi:GTP-binding protein